MSKCSVSVLSVGVVCECSARALGHRGCPEELPAGRRPRLSAGLAHARLVSTPGTGLPFFTGSIGPGFVAACVCLVLGKVIVGGCAARVAAASSPGRWTGKVSCQGLRAPERVLGRSGATAAPRDDARGSSPLCRPHSVSTSPCLEFSWEGDGERHALRRGGEFRRSGRGQDTKHKNWFDLRVADFHRASQSRSIFSAHEFDVVPSTGRSWEGGGERQALGRSVVFWVDHKR